MDDLTKRNFNALADGLKSLRAETNNLLVEYKKRGEHVAQLTTELQELKREIAIMKAMSFGTGPTT